MRFKSKPVVINAIQFLGEKSFMDMDLAWGNNFLRNAEFIHHQNGSESMTISTPEGVMAAIPTDWIIKGTIGEFYPCKDEVFQRKYEPVVE